MVASLAGLYYRMLVSDTRERNEGILTLESVSRKDWHCIQAFYQSAEELVTGDNVEDILATACLCQLEALKKHCHQVLMDTDCRYCQNGEYTWDHFQSLMGIAQILCR